MKIEDLKFEVCRTRPASEKHPASIAVEVICESKKILGMDVVKFGPLKSTLVIFYEEK